MHSQRIERCRHALRWKAGTLFSEPAQAVHLRGIEQAAILGPALHTFCGPHSVQPAALRQDVQLVAMMRNCGDG
jgi:hypothetical protein